MYKFLHALANLYLKIFFGLRVYGRENIPAGGVVLVGNHPYATDPIYVGLSVPSSRRMRFMGKKQLFAFPPLRWFITWCGAYPIDRGASDIAAMKKTLEMLKSGELVIVFPDGTRNRLEDPSMAKTGAALLAVKSGMPVLPMYLEPGRRFLRKRMTVTFGMPYMPKMPEGIGRSDGYRQVVLDMMERVYALKPVQA